MLKKLLLPLLAIVGTVSAQLVEGVPTRQVEGPVTITDRPKVKSDKDVPWPASYEDMGRILTCPYGITKRSDVVLLVHGTGSTGFESWKNVYVPILKDNRYTPCWLDLPNRSMQDNQLTAGYVAYNVHMISRFTNKKVAIISHSSGCPVTQWGLTWWPSARKHVRAFIALGPDFGGVMFEGINKICSINGHARCQPSLWQQFMGSKFMQALNDYARVAVVPTTVIWTKWDQLVIPAKEVAQLAGATVIRLQDVCRFKIVDHYLLIFDRAVWMLVLDALKNGGHASASRVKNMGRRHVCIKPLPTGAEFSALDGITAFKNDLMQGMLGNEKARVEKEPDLAPYVAKLVAQKKQPEHAVAGSQQDKRYQDDSFKSKVKHYVSKAAMEAWNGVMGLLGSHKKFKI